MGTEELEGITKALEILTSDEARELFGKAINRPGQSAAAPSFLELSAVTNGMATPVKGAYEALKKQAKATHSLRLARLAAKLGTTAQQKQSRFDDVLKAIDDMIQTLKDEEQDDIAKKDQCKDEFQVVNRQLGDVNWKIEKNEAKIAKLESLIEEKEEEKAKTTEAIAEVEQQMEDMTSQRTA